MNTEIKRLICAIQFLTRLPTPPLSEFEDDLITQSARYFPGVGLLVGALSALVFTLADQLNHSPVSAVLAVATSVLLTGAFHEDGLADTADGLGGGLDRAKRLSIMKDSRIGTYGACALVLSLALRISALYALPVMIAAFALISSHAVARTIAVIAMYALPYAGDVETAKHKPVPMGVSAASLAIALGIGFSSLTLLPPMVGAVAVITALIPAVWLANKARNLIGGYVGDVLGGIEQCAECGFLIGTLWALNLV
jgi:adenosylcobinamide-GDP ribazoletransferase